MEYININDIYSNSKNFYPQTGIEEKEKQILAAGLLENLVVTKQKNPKGDGEYRLISGERRWRALKNLVEKGHSEFQTVPCTVLEEMSDEDEVLKLVISNTSRDKDLFTHLTEEKTVHKILKAYKEAGKSINGINLSITQIRNAEVSLLGISAATISRLEYINSHIDPDFYTALREEKNGLTLSYLYDLVHLPQETQRRYLAKWRSTGDWEKIKEKPGKADNSDESSTATQKNENQANAGNIHAVSGDSAGGSFNDETEKSTSSPLPLCYKCGNYETCGKKSPTVQSCTDWVKRPSAEKTTEQLYNEEQARINKETARKLDDMGIQPESDPLSSLAHMGKNKDDDSTDVHGAIKVTPALFSQIASGRQPYIILKDTKHRTNDVLTIREFRDGNYLKGQIKAEITCMDTSATSTGILDGYIVAGLHIVELVPADDGVV